jgi:tetratricopeptide (TPR) repeat protein
MRRKPAIVIRNLRRHGLSIFSIIADRMICKLGSIGKTPLSSRTVALAATRITRWKLAEKFWDKTDPNRLNPKQLALLASAMIRAKRYEDALKVAEAATSTGKLSLELELARAEAFWYLKDLASLEKSRKKAITLLRNPSEAQISLIMNENQVVNIFSRLVLLKGMEKDFEKILKLAEKLGAVEHPESPAFVFWDSGALNAPKLVKTCIHQMHSVYGEKLVELNSGNLQEYLPEERQLRRVAKLWPANYSDAIRVGLLARHGGAWLDATVFTVENSLLQSEKYLKSDFFVHSYNGPRIASWFMVARPGSHQARMLYAAMIHYWSTNRKLKNYFLFHDIFEVLYHLDPKFKAEFDAGSQIDARPSLNLQKTLWSPRDEVAMKSILEDRPVQKLTYKPGKNPHGKGTLFEWFESRA